MILFTISDFFKALIALLVMSNKFGLSVILLDLENREISQLKGSQNMYRLLNTFSPYDCTHDMNYPRNEYPRITHDMNYTELPSAICQKAS